MKKTSGWEPKMRRALDRGKSHVSGIRTAYLKAYCEGKTLPVLLPVAIFVLALVLGASWQDDPSPARTAHCYFTLVIASSLELLRQYSEYHRRRSYKDLLQELNATRDGMRSLREEVQRHFASVLQRDKYLQAEARDFRRAAQTIREGTHAGVSPYSVLSDLKDSKKRRNLLRSQVQELQIRLELNNPGIRFRVSLWNFDPVRGRLVHEYSWSIDQDAPSVFADDPAAEDIQVVGTGSPMSFLATSWRGQWYSIPNTADLTVTTPYTPPSDPHAREEIKSIFCHKVGSTRDHLFGIIAVFADRAGFFDEDSSSNFVELKNVVEGACIALEHEYSKLEHCDAVVGLVASTTTRRYAVIAHYELRGNGEGV